MSDKRLFAEAFACLKEFGCLGGFDAFCCNTCATYELLPQYERDGVPAVWTCENYTFQAFDEHFIKPGEFVMVHVLGDMAMVETVMREKFGDRIGDVRPETEEYVGSLRVFARGQTAAMWRLPQMARIA